MNSFESKSNHISFSFEINTKPERSVPEWVVWSCRSFCHLRSRVQRQLGQNFVYLLLDVLFQFVLSMIGIVKIWVYMASNVTTNFITKLVLITWSSRVSMASSIISSIMPACVVKRIINNMSIHAWFTEWNVKYVVNEKIKLEIQTAQALMDSNKCCRLRISL